MNRKAVKRIRCETTISTADADDIFHSKYGMGKSSIITKYYILRCVGGWDDSSFLAPLPRLYLGLEMNEHTKRMNECRTFPFTNTQALSFGE